MCCKQCEHAYKYYKKLKDDNYNQYCRYHDLINSVESLLSSAAGQMISNKKLVVCDIAELQKLVELKNGKEDVLPFLGHLHLRLQIVADAIGLFIGKYQNTMGTETLYGRLENLYKSVIAYKNHVGEDKHWKIDQTTDSIIDIIKNGKENDQNKTPNN
jgi:hypothetical protein